jgi:hypothetical protein
MGFVITENRLSENSRNTYKVMYLETYLHLIEIYKERNV